MRLHSPHSKQNTAVATAHRRDLNVSPEPVSGLPRESRPPLMSPLEYRAKGQGNGALLVSQGAFIAKSKFATGGYAACRKHPVGGDGKAS